MTAVFDVADTTCSECGIVNQVEDLTPNGRDVFDMFEYEQTGHAVYMSQVICRHCVVAHEPRPQL
jgi:hypothetical protein